MFFAKPMSSIHPKTLTARTGQQFTIRTAQPEDAAALFAYIRLVAGETEFFIRAPDEYPKTEEQERKWIQDHLDHPGQIGLLAEAVGKIIGTVSFENGRQRRIAHLGSLGMPLDWRWRGRLRPGVSFRCYDYPFVLSWCGWALVRHGRSSMGTRSCFGSSIGTESRGGGGDGGGLVFASWWETLPRDSEAFRTSFFSSP